MATSEKSTKLLEKQFEFMQMLALLINYIYGHGYRCSLAIGYIPPELSIPYRKYAKFNKMNLHEMRLAVDLNIFRNGVWLKDGKQFKDIGEYWGSLGGSWGGNFKTNPDGNHFSLSHDGIK